MDENYVQNMVRVGIVTDVDKKDRRIRVRFPNLNMTSGWLYVLQFAPEISWMPSVNDKVLCIYIPVFNGDGFVLGAI